MRLHNELTLAQAWLPAVKIEPGKEQPKVTLLFRTQLTREVAEAFGCLELIYAGSVPRSGVESMKLEGEEADCEVHLDHDNVKMKLVADHVGNYLALMEGDGPKLKFHVRLKGYEVAAAELVQKLGVDPLKITLKPAQMELELKAEGEPDEPEEDEPEAEQGDLMNELGLPATEDVILQ
jgi:hypothetical protein